MARKAKEILLARGYTEAELTSMATLLADPKFCAAIEAEAAEVDRLTAASTQLQKDLDDDAAWYRDTAVPALTKATNEAIEERSRRAQLEARLKAMQDYGLAKVAADEGHTPANPNPSPNPNPSNLNPNPSNPSNPKPIDDSRFVTVDLYNQGFEKVGDAIEMAQDIVGDYQELFGKRLPGGIGALRKDYREAVSSRRFKGDLRQFAEEKFKFADKRAELQAAETKAREDAIRAEERTKVMSELGNPMTRPMMSSRNPFTNRAQAQTPTPGSTSTPTPPSKPWDKSESERAGNRVSKFANKVLQSA